jgi:hypothetical protein
VKHQAIFVQLAIKGNLHVSFMLQDLKHGVKIGQGWNLTGWGPKFRGHLAPTDKTPAKTSRSQNGMPFLLKLMPLSVYIGL